MLSWLHIVMHRYYLDRFDSGIRPTRSATYENNYLSTSDPGHTRSQTLIAALHPTPMIALRRLCPGAFCAPPATAASRCSSSSSLNSVRMSRRSGSEGCGGGADGGVSRRGLRERNWLRGGGHQLEAPDGFEPPAFLISLFPGLEWRLDRDCSHPDQHGIPAGNCPEIITPVVLAHPSPRDRATDTLRRRETLSTQITAPRTRPTPTHSS